MLLRLRNLFRFEHQQAQHDRLRQRFKPRVERLEDRLAPTVTITSPGDQTSTEGAATSFNLGSFSDSNPNATPWQVDVNWGDATAHTTFTTSSQGNLASQP